MLYCMQNNDLKGWLFPMIERYEQPEKEPGVFKTIALLIGVLAFLAAAAGALAFIWKRVSYAMKALNKETHFEPFEEDDLTAEDDKTE